MVISTKLLVSNLHLAEKARKIKLLLTDVDGVLTDTGVYYSELGEELKRYSIRDGMGVERLRTLLGIGTGIITGEKTGSIIQRAKKLGISILHLGIKDKQKILKDIVSEYNLTEENVAFIGDDINDYEILISSGLSASPSDGMDFIKESVDYICTAKGGFGAFREFAELIIALNYNNVNASTENKNEIKEKKNAGITEN